ncbi:hypothetical protein [Pandoraea communis]|uniref:hypothetical protein n=1 Tax=Pandoraea communis TaxID=2508297 RepID=UPI0025A4D860|nr:hypothetical protein [Pandoraea communis]MDM8359742.1 hypothetical protein [Pandoraea communis]
MISNADPAHAMRMLIKIRDTCSEADFKLAIEVMRGSAIFKKNSIGRDFNKKFPSPVARKAISVFRSSDVLSKVNQYASKLKRLVGLCHDVLTAISEFRFAEAVNHCREIVEEDGVSICLLRYLHFIRNHVPGQPLVKDIDGLLQSIAVDNVRYISSVIRELSSGKTDYFNISDRVNKAEGGVGVAIARSFIDHIPRSEEEFSATLSGFYLVSLFDAFLYLCRLQDAHLPFVPTIELDLSGEYRRLASISVDVNKLYDVSNSGVGLDFFREAFLLIELGDFFRFRTIHSALFNTVEGKEDRRVSFERELLIEYFGNLDDISDTGSDCKPHVLSIDRYKAEEACHFQNSSALMYYLERTDGRIGFDELKFVQLMSRTRDIGLICPVQHIESIKADAQSDELKIVANCLSHIKQKSQLKEHELRSVLQDAAAKKFNGKLTDLLGYIYDTSPAVAEHLIQTADETFLSKLFQIINNPNGAIQERASILEWYGNKVGDVSFLERAKNLRIDVQINRERGTIDDSRIYVDPVKFTQWINDQVLDDFAILLESLPQPVEPIVASLPWEKVKTGINAYEQLASLILICFEEFCSNKIYGIASYLGRRIRHGTLKGTGYNDVMNIVKDDRFASLFAIRDFEDAYSSWLRDYESSLDDLRDKYLHIRDKSKPDGLIFREFRSPSKRTAASHLLHDILKSFSVNKSCVELPYIILEYCWRLIEEDLANIRKFVMEKKAQYAVFRAPTGYSLNHRQREIQEFCQELNSLTAEKFRTIESWFNKPSIASPSADVVLLFKAVVSEIKGLFPQYRPQVAVDEHGFMLNGGTYFVIYDALFILMHNAAENGKNDGRLAMDIALDDIAGKKRVSIQLTSELRPGDVMSDVRKSISSALEGDCEDALIFEGRSGIKKLKRMEQVGYIDDVKYEFGYDTVHASFSFRIDY